MRLAKAKREFNWVELPKPERHGFKKSFIIRPDVRKGATPTMLAVYEDILKLCNQTIVAPDKKFVKKDWRTKKKVPMELKLKHIMPHKWEELPSDRHRAQFIMVMKKDISSRQYKAYEVRDPWMYVEQIKPHYITHRLLVDPQLDSELAEIENKIERANLWPAFSKAMGWRGDWRSWSKIRSERIAEQLFKANLAELASPEIVSPYSY